MRFDEFRSNALDQYTEALTKLQGGNPAFAKDDSRLVELALTGNQMFLAGVYAAMTIYESRDKAQINALEDAARSVRAEYAPKQHSAKNAPAPILKERPAAMTSQEPASERREVSDYIIRQH